MTTPVPTDPIPETPQPVLEGEVIEDSLGPTTSERTIRVYGPNPNGDDDFRLTLPPGCSLTFGYFNPGKTQEDGFADRYNRGKSDHEKRSALRVYGPSDGTKKDQLACFLGVRGFRDESIKLQKFVQKVTVEHRLDDDGEGNVEWGGKQTRAITAKVEDEGVF